MWWVTLAWAADPDELDGRGWLTRGVDAMEAGRWDEAADAFRRSGEAGHAPALAQYNLACAHSRAGAVDAALAAVNEALVLGWSDLGALTTDPDLAAVRARKGKDLSAAARGLRAVEWLAGLAQRDGVYVSRSALRVEAGALCGEGVAAACLVKDADLADRAALSRAFAGPCTGGDAIACLGAAWLSMPGWSTGAELRLPADPERFLEQVNAACAANLQAGCTEVALAYRVGFAAFPWDRQHDERMEAACARSEPRACGYLGHGDEGRAAHLVQAAEAAEGEARLRLLVDACVARIPSACASLADGVVALPLVARKAVDAMCADGEASSCALLAQSDAAAGRITVEVARARLDAACVSWPRACEEAEFLRQGAPPVGAYTGPPRTEVEVKRAVFDARDTIHQCLVDALADDPSASGWLEGAVRVGASGEIEGVHLRGAFSDAHRACVERALLGQPGFSPWDRPSRGELRISAFHRAEVKLGTDVVDAGGEVARVAKDADAWGAAFDACALGAGIDDDGEGAAFEFTALRGGALGGVRAVGEDAETEAATCAAQWLSAQRSTTPVRLTTRMTAQVRFLQPHAPEAERVEVTPLPVAVRADAPPSEPVRVRQLVLVVGRSLAEGTKGRLSADSTRSIRAAHDGMAEALARMTEGRVAADVEVRWVDAELAFAFGEAEGVRRYILEPDDLPRAVVDAIEPGAWDSVFIWAPIPKGFPRVHLGTTFSVPLRGATVSTGFVPSGSELLANPGLPAWYLPLHELYHQVEFRAQWVVGARPDFPPSNHRPRIVDGRTLDPQDWLGSTTTLDWYEATLPMFPRVFWEEVWARPEVADTNLASVGVPFAPENRHALTDRVLAFGGFPAAWADAGVPAMFGVNWSEPQRVTRFVARTRGTWRDARAEARVGDTWVRAARVTADADGTWTAIWSGEPVEGVRWVVEPAKEGAVECVEVEAWADSGPS